MRWLCVFLFLAVITVMLLYQPSTDPRDYGISETHVPHNVFVVWAGRNPMSKTRQQALAILKKNIGVHVTMVTPDNLSSFLVEPLPDNYKYLSAVHKSDVLRCYLMHFWGGGYCDIKRVYDSWKPSFLKLNASPQLYAVGTRENVIYCLLRSPHRYSCNKRNNSIICANQIICKKQTPLTGAWYNNVKMIVDGLNVKDAPPAYPQDHRGDWRSRYPVGWEQLAGDFFGTMSYEYRRHIDSTLPKFRITRYR